MGNPHLVLFVDDPAVAASPSTGRGSSTTNASRPAPMCTSCVPLRARATNSTCGCGSAAWARRSAAAPAPARAQRSRTGAAWWGRRSPCTCPAAISPWSWAPPRWAHPPRRPRRARLRHDCQPADRGLMSRRRLTATEVDLGVVRQRALLVGTGFGLRDAEAAQASLEELAALTDTAGADPVELVLQRRDRPDPATYIGSGKAQELKELGVALDIDLVVFDDELSPAQQRNLEKLFEVDVVDRTALILDIFAQHAKSQEGMVQVELAQLRYRLPRLRGRGNQLSQQGAGIGTRGPGETQLEVDRRRITTRMSAPREGAGAPRQEPRHAAQVAHPPRRHHRRAGRLHQRGQVHAAQPPHRGQRAGRGQVVLHPRPGHPPPAPPRRRDRPALRHRRVREPPAAPAGGVVPLHARGVGRRRSPRARRRRLRARSRSADRRPCTTCCARSTRTRCPSCSWSTRPTSR